MADPILRVRCPRATDAGHPHVAVDVHQPLTPSKMAEIMAVLTTCSCGAELGFATPKKVTRG